MTRPTVLAYYFPGWHTDPRLSARYGEGWTEWRLLQDARPRFDGHRQPRIPADGYLDEADPEVMAGKIDQAADHGVDAFLFDYYWYEDGPFLERALDEGYLGAPNRERVEFALMWANHDWVELFPAGKGDQETLKRGAIDRATFDAMTDHLVAHYFSQPEYLKIDGAPFFSLYQIGSLIEGLGGVAATREALDEFRRKTIAAGHRDLHLDATVWGFGVLPHAVTTTRPEELIRALGFASASSYVWVHHSDVESAAFPIGDWDAVADDAFAAYRGYVDELGVPFIPNVSVGWDSSPRTEQSAEFEPVGYPWYPVFDGTPAQFERGLRRAVELLEPQQLAHPMLAINAWNEWTEGSALEPDTVNGTAFLEAIRTVLGTRADVVDAEVA